MASPVRLRPGRPRKAYTGGNYAMDALIAYIQEKGMTYMSLADRAGYNRSAFGNAVNRRALVRLQTFTDLCEAAGLEVKLVPIKKRRQKK